MSGKQIKRARRFAGRMADAEKPSREVFASGQKGLTVRYVEGTYKRLWKLIKAGAKK